MPLDTVLIVDDSPTICELLGSRLRDAGYQVHVAANGKQAIECVLETTPGIVITDWEMPHLNGLELCQAVRSAELPNYVYMVMITGRSDHQNLVAALEAGADDYLTKPVCQHELLARIKAASRVLQLQNRLAQMASCDMLTQLNSRRAFIDALKREWSRARRYRLPLSCVMLDIDFFKQVNDNYGHPAGDKVIQHVATILRESCRDSDMPSRYGGEEFCLILPETTEEDAMIFAERLRTKIANSPIEIDGHSIQLTASLGIAQAVAGVEDENELVRIADDCLLAAKQRGRNRCVRFQQLCADEDLSQSEAWLDQGCAKDAMLPLLHFVQPSWLLVDVVSYFLTYRITSAPVTADDGTLVGIVSEKDILGVVHSAPAAQQRVVDIMHTNVIAYDESSPLSQILRFMRRAPMRNVIVTSGGRATGVISRGSLMRWIAERNWPSGSATVAAHPAGRITTLLSQHAQELQSLSHHVSPEERGDCVVGISSRMQQLLDELLAVTTAPLNSSSILSG